MYRMRVTNSESASWCKHIIMRTRDKTVPKLNHFVYLTQNSLCQRQGIIEEVDSVLRAEVVDSRTGSLSKLLLVSNPVLWARLVRKSRTSSGLTEQLLIGVASVQSKRSHLTSPMVILSPISAQRDSIDILVLPFSSKETGLP